MRKVKMTRENKIKTIQINTNDPQSVILDSDEDCLVRRDAINRIVHGRRKKTVEGCHDRKW